MAINGSNNCFLSVNAEREVICVSSSASDENIVKVSEWTGVPTGVCCFPLCHLLFRAPYVFSPLLPMYSYNVCGYVMTMGYVYL